jgi:hypothetical protein
MTYYHSNANCRIENEEQRKRKAVSWILHTLLTITAIQPTSIQIFRFEYFIAQFLDILYIPYIPKYIKVFL